MWCQQKVALNLMDHPVHFLWKTSTNTRVFRYREESSMTALCTTSTWPRGCSGSTRRRCTRLRTLASRRSLPWMISTMSPSPWNSPLVATHEVIWVSIVRGDWKLSFCLKNSFSFGFIFPILTTLRKMSRSSLHIRGGKHIDRFCVN